MNRPVLAFSDLKAQAEELAQREPKLKNDDLFVLWFIRAYITGNDEEARKALAAHAKEAAQASVLVKVMQVPCETGKNDDGFDALLSKIVGGTNFQNAIRPPDLMSNDRRQIEIERSFRKLGYIYLRKRQNKGDAKRGFGGKGMLRLRAGKSPKRWPDVIWIRSSFARERRISLTKTSIRMYSRHSIPIITCVDIGWAGQCPIARRATRNAGTQSGSHSISCGHRSVLLRTRQSAEAFRLLAERDKSDLLPPLLAAIDRVFVAVNRFFMLNKGSGATAVDVSNFFRHTKGRHKQFEQLWKDEGKKSRAPFLVKLEQIRDVIAAFER